MNAKNGTGTLQARAEDTRRAILDTAVELYLSQGADNTTVSAVIERAGLGRTTFYRYFRDADDVLNQAVTRDFDALLADFETQRYEHESLEEQLVDDIVWFIRQLRRRPQLEAVQTAQVAQHKPLFVEAHPLPSAVTFANGNRCFSNPQSRSHDKFQPNRLAHEA